MKLRGRDRRDLQSLLAIIVSWWIGVLITAAAIHSWWWGLRTGGVLTVVSVSTVVIIYLRRGPR
jgi:hypothetical protein